jgi:hypothetical protein
VYSKTLRVLPFFFVVACSRLNTLTPQLLSQAQEKWNATRPEFYRLTIEMKGNRVEAGRFEVMVRSGEVVSLTRNGRAIMPGRGQDYSMDGLFRMLHQEVELARNPTLLGAPPGYSAYPMARFDEPTGRLIEFRRTVGGTNNAIDVRVARYEPEPH